MDHKDLCEHTRIRLIAAAVGHQQCTKTASNIIPIPGGDRVVAIGTPAQVRALLAAEVDERCPHCDGTGDVHRPDGTWAGTCTCPAGTERPTVDAAAICDGVAAKSRNSLFRSGAKICAGEIRAAQRCSVQGCTEPAGPNTVGACTTHLAEFKNWSLARANGDQVDSEGGHHD